jgi:hypothetical protein
LYLHRFGRRLLLAYVRQSGIGNEVNIMFLVWFALYFIFLGFFVFLPLRYVAAIVYASFPEDQVVPIFVSAFLLVTFCSQIYFSYKSGVIKMSGQVGFLHALRLSLSEFVGFIKIAFMK